jgi:hypothetical protein
MEVEMEAKQLLDRINWRTGGALLILMAGVVLFWNTWAVYPLKILVVFFHELSHGLAAWVTGGSIERIELVAQQGGLCVTRGGSTFLTLSAGYLGSLFWGGVILVVAARTRHDKWFTMGLGILLLLVTLLFIRPLVGFGFAFGLFTGGAMVAAGRLLPEKANDLLLKVIGLTSCLYAVLDIKSDILDRSYLRSDARMLAEYTGIPTLVWGVVWILLAVVAAMFFLYIAATGPEQQEPATGAASSASAVS